MVGRKTKWRWLRLPLLDEHIDRKRLGVVAVESLQRKKTDETWLDWAVDVLQSREDLSWRSDAAAQ